MFSYNKTEYAISRAYFHGVLVTPGRSIPWVEEDFNYQIRGGIEPNESATWKLAPNMFGEWSEAPKDRSGLLLMTTVEKLDGPNGEPLFDAEFLESDQQRLDGLRLHLSELDD